MTDSTPQEVTAEETAAAPAPVTAELDNFEAASEFGNFPDGQFDAATAVACGQRACSLFQHVKYGTVLDSAEIIAVVEDMKAKGFDVTHGTTIHQLQAYFSRPDAVGGQLDIVIGNDYGSTWDEIHATLLAHAGRDGVVVEVSRASLLPDNEQGVFNHYVGEGAIDPVKGYLTGNGDCLEALAGNGGHGKIVPAQWVDAPEMARAVPIATLIIRNLPHTVNGVHVVPGQPATTPGTPSGWSDDGSTLKGPNGVAVVLGFRELVLGSKWNPSNVPTDVEHGDADSSYQAFADGVATWVNGSGAQFTTCGFLAAHLAPAAGAGGGPGDQANDAGELTLAGSGENITAHGLEHNYVVAGNITTIP